MKIIRKFELFVLFEKLIDSYNIEVLAIIIRRHRLGPILKGSQEIAVKLFLDLFACLNLREYAFSLQHSKMPRNGADSGTN